MVANREVGRRVLIVDDSIDTAAVLADLLDEFGFRTTIAHDGPQALTVARQFRPAVCLLDVGLPTMNGYELATRLRAEIDPGEPLVLIAITGYGEDRYRQLSNEAGFDAHLVKPIDIDQLLALIAAQPVYGTQSPFV